MVKDPLPATFAFITIVLSGLSLSHASWAQEATVVGTLTANGESVELPYVYIYAEEKGFYNDNDPTWKILFAARQIPERELEDSFLDFPYVKLGLTHTSEFDDTPRMQVYSQDVRLPNKPGNISSSTYPELELEKNGPEGFAGRIYLAKPVEFFEDTFQYDFTFQAPLSDPDAPIGEPLPPGGGEPGQAYVDWVKAVSSGDVEQIKRLVPAEMAEMLETKEASEVAEELEMLKLMSPSEVTILSGSSDGETAVLEVEGLMEGQKVHGKITLTRHGSHWIATKTAWE